MWFEVVTHSAQTIPQEEASRSHPLPSTTSSGSSLSVQRHRGAHQQKDLPQLQIPKHQSRDPAGTPRGREMLSWGFMSVRALFFQTPLTLPVTQAQPLGFKTSQHLELDHSHPSPGGTGECCPCHCPAHGTPAARASRAL